MDNKVKNYNVPKPKKTIGQPFKIRYTNHWIEKLNITALMHNDELNNTIPKCVRDKGTSSVIYTYKPTVQGKLINYKRTVSEYQNEDLSTMECNCSTSQYKDVI